MGRTPPESTLIIATTRTSSTMKRNCLIIPLVLMCLGARSQTPCSPLGLNLSADQNYVLTLSPRVPLSDASTLGSQNVCNVNATVQYFDGLGRPLQTVQVKGSPDVDRDLVQAVQYDGFGREARKYQPYASSSADGSYKTGALTAGQGVFDFYNPAPGGDSGDQMGNGVVRNPYPYSQTVFEPSPLNRVVERGAPGTDWQPVANSTSGHTMKMDYGSNATYEVRSWAVTADGASGNAFYAANELYKTVSKDENWVSGTQGTVEEFKDKEGRVVLKRNWLYNGVSYSTYYVYDDLGNLRYVLPPAVNDNGKATLTSFAETGAAFDNYIYGYHYDGRRRLVEKKVPGRGWEYMVYNKLDQIVLTQDAVQRNANQWVYHKYDGLGRGIISGLYTDAIRTSRVSMQQAVDDETDINVNSPIKPLWEQRSSGGMGYTDSSFPRGTASQLTIDYYDDYDFPGNTFGAQGPSQSNMTRGLPTGTKTNILGTSDMLLSVMYYDKYGRVVQSRSGNHLNGTDVLDNTYNDITGELLSSTHTQTMQPGGAPSPTQTTIAVTHTYDHMGRKLETRENINAAGEVVLSSLEYNGIGQLKDKVLHNNLNTTSYTYNERGWLRTQVNSLPSYNTTLNYQQFGGGLYNGNIKSQYWITEPNAQLHSYIYLYDQLNRLTNGYSDENRNEALEYDEMGNITQLTRDNSGTPTVYQYANGNQLSSLSGGMSGSYTYDANGNQLTDGAKGLGFDYNYLDLVQGFHNSSQSVSYTWLADGGKLRKAGPGVTRDYVGEVEYNNGILEFVRTEEGRAYPDGSGGFRYEYQIRDHLGNTRALLNQDGTLRERTDYYPFGLEIARTGAASPPNGYKYNGKELQPELGLNQYDYGARFYDPVIGRFNVIDRFAEKYYGLTNYQYAANNPIKNIDLNGDSIRVSSSITDNKLLNNSFNDFASTKAGRRFLSKYAAAGQTIGGYTFKENGKFSSKGIDINYSAANLS